MGEQQLVSKKNYNESDIGSVRYRKRFTNISKFTYNFSTNNYVKEKYNKNSELNKISCNNI